MRVPLDTRHLTPFLQSLEASEDEQHGPMAGTRLIGRRWLARHGVDLGACIAAYALALIVRLRLIDSPPYGDEGLYYTLARRPGLDPVNVHFLYAQSPMVLHQFFYQRPLHYLLLAPGAQGSFETFRLGHVLLSSLLPVATVLLLRADGTRRVLAYAAAAATALLPSFVVWGSIAYPDSLATTATAFALWALRSQRHGLVFVFGLAALWTKEAAAIPLGLALVVELLRARAARRLWPLRLRRAETAMVFAFALGPLPHLVALRLGAPFPGALRPGDHAAVFDGLLLTTWFLPILAAGLLWPRTRPLAAVALGSAATYFALHVFLDQAVEAWYVVATSHLALVGVALVVDEGWTRLAPRGAPGRAANVLVTGAVAFLLVAAIAMPTGTAKGRLLKPLSRLSDNDLEDAIRFEHTREAPLRQALTELRMENGQTVFVVDVYLPFVLHPIASTHTEALAAWTGVVVDFGLPIEPWIQAVEGGANRTLIEKHDNALNEALRHVYASCAVFENDMYVVLESGACTGRGAELEQAVAAGRPGPIGFLSRGASA
jgi:hypothetical protein